jgi:hypothetical protein
VLIRIVILQALISNLHQRLQDDLQIFVLVFMALCEDGLHARIEYLDIILPLRLQLLLSQQISIIVETVILEGLPYGNPAASAEEI